MAKDRENEARTQEDPDVRDMIRKDVARVAGTFQLLRHGVIAAVLAFHLAATAILTILVTTEPFSYPVMYVLMGLLLGLVAIVRFTAQAAGRRISSGLLLIGNLVLLSFWIWVLLDAIPGRPVVTGLVAVRHDLPALWIPISLYAVSGVGMIVQTVLRWRMGRRHPG